MSAGPSPLILRPDWLCRRGVQTILDAVGEARFVGGAVRDALLGRPVGDLDMATPLSPEEVLRRLASASIKAIPTGLSHGTITALTDGEKIEITTLRRDVETDGRRAVVEFTGSWAEDAARRDFTMNALYLDRDGVVWDPVGGGVADCLAGRVRFVGDPRMRIEEDALRLLRFYRFHAHYGRTPPDDSARMACRAMAASVRGLAGERVRTELLKLLSAPDPVPAVRLMADDGILAELFPHPVRIEVLARLLTIDPATDPLRRMAALITPDDAVPVAERLKLSRRERDRLIAATSGQPTTDLAADDRAQRKRVYRIGADAYRDRVLLAAAETGVADVTRLLSLADAWPDPKLPVGGADAADLGIAPGPAVGSALRTVEAWWIDRDFRPDRDVCLRKLREVARSLTAKPPGAAET